MLRDFLREKKIGVCYQPIVALNGGMSVVHGYEALARPRQSTPDTIFREAEKAGLTTDLDLFCFENAVRNFPNGAKLFVNLYPSTLPRMASLLEPLQDRSGSGYVFEILERENVDCQKLRRLMDLYRKTGVSFAVNDIAPGNFGDKTAENLRALKPDYIKLDLRCTQGMSQDPELERFSLSVRDVSRRIGSKVIAEGVETEKHLTAIRKMGLDYAQGFYVDRKFPPYSKPS